MTAPREPGERGRDLELAVTLHAVEPATFERCALIRDWLADNGVDRATLLVVPATDLHPLADRSGELVQWLIERREAGDAIAQCGFTGRATTRGGGRAHGEFAGLDATETRRAVDAGWRVMRLAGVEPGGFVAPAYRYTRPLHDVLAQRFSWWMGARRIYGAGAPAGGLPLAPAIVPCGRHGTAVRRRSLSRRAARRDQLLRIDVDPRELRPRQVRALEALLADAAERRVVTGAELAPARRERRGDRLPRLSGASSA
jgi:hypothetical protein